MATFGHWRRGECLPSKINRYSDKRSAKATLNLQLDFGLSEWRDIKFGRFRRAKGWSVGVRSGERYEPSSHLRIYTTSFFRVGKFFGVCAISAGSNATCRIGAVVPLNIPKSIPNLITKAGQANLQSA
ncbi:hypothetical protein [Bradyrhizobium sp. ARR65]|uniref:hypothetical protein n=1 Tax=Bradyrhizobium sp. ARR65 TaxID=1040989 RepID=UPI0012FBF593|nr:hypothetical protein [Bradyrhizobium sp. ARR65]